MINSSQTKYISKPLSELADTFEIVSPGDWPVSAKLVQSKLESEWVIAIEKYESSKEDGSTHEPESKRTQWLMTQLGKAVWILKAVRDEAEGSVDLGEAARLNCLGDTTRTEWAKTRSGSACQTS